MRRFLKVLAMLGLIAAPTAATAGIYADNLSKCMVKSMTTEDQSVYMVWMLSSLSQHPAARPYFTMTDAQREGAVASAANLFQRLLLVDCRSATMDALKYEGTGALVPAFSALDDAALLGIMSDPAVSTALRSPLQHLDRDKFIALLKEAGLPVGGEARSPAR